MVSHAIADCSHHERQQKKSSIKFYRFPKNNKIKSKQINICRRVDSLSVHVAAVCSAHFDENNYLHDLKRSLYIIGKLSNLPMKLIFNPDAILHENCLHIVQF